MCWPIHLRSGNGQINNNYQMMISQLITLSVSKTQADGLWWLIHKFKPTTGLRSRNKRTSSKLSDQTSHPNNSKWSWKIPFNLVFLYCWKMSAKQLTVYLNLFSKRNLSSQVPLTEWSLVTKNSNTAATLDSTWQQNWENHIIHLKSALKSPCWTSKSL